MNWDSLLCFAVVLSLFSLPVVNAVDSIDCWNGIQNGEIQQLHEFRRSDVDDNSASIQSMEFMQGSFITSELAWSPDSRQIAVGWDLGTGPDIFVWDAIDGQLITMLGPVPSEFTAPQIEGGNGIGLRWSPNGRYLAALFNDDTIRIWDSENDWMLTTIELERQASYSIFWSPDSTRIGAQGNIWNVQTGELVREDVGTIIQSADSWHSINRVNDQLVIENLETQAAILAPVDWAIDMVWTEEYGRLMSLDEDGDTRYVEVWDLETLQALFRIENHGFGLPATRLSPDGTSLVIAYEFQGEIKLWNVDSGELMLTTGGPVTWSLDGDCFASTISRYEAQNSQIRILDVVTQQYLEFKVPSWVRRLVWSPDGTMLAATSDDGTLRIWGAGDN